MEHALASAWPVIALLIAARTRSLVNGVDVAFGRLAFHTYVESSFAHVASAPRALARDAMTNLGSARISKMATHGMSITVR